MLVALWILMFLTGNIVYIYYTFSQEELYNRYSSVVHTGLTVVALCCFSLSSYTLNLLCVFLGFFHSFCVV